MPISFCFIYVYRALLLSLDLFFSPFFPLLLLFLPFSPLAPCFCSPPCEHHQACHHRRRIGCSLEIGIEEQRNSNGSWGNVSCWQVSNCQVNRELAVKDTSHLRAPAPPCRTMPTTGWLLKWVYRVCCMGQSSPESPWVVPWTDTCGQPKACFLSVRVPWGKLGAEQVWRGSAEVRGEGKKASGKLSEGVGRVVSWASSTAFFLLSFAMSMAAIKQEAQEKRVSDVDHAKAKLGSWASFYLLGCVSVQSRNYCHRLRGASSWTTSSLG